MMFSPRYVDAQTGRSFGSQRAINDWYTERRRKRAQAQAKAAKKAQKKAAKAWAKNPTNPENVFKEWQKAQDEAKAANEARYEEIKQGYDAASAASKQGYGDLLARSEAGYADLAAKNQAGYADLAAETRGGYADALAASQAGYADLAAQTGQGYSDALAASQRGYGDWEKDAMALLEGLGTTERGRIRDRWASRESGAMQDLVSRGLKNSSDLGGVRRGMGKYEDIALGALDESIRAQNLNTMGQVRGSGLSAANVIRANQLAAQQNLGTAGLSAANTLTSAGLATGANLGSAGLASGANIGSAGLAAGNTIGAGAIAAGTNLATGKLGAIERRTDEYPSYEMMVQLAQQQGYGQGYAGGRTAYGGGSTGGGRNILGGGQTLNRSGASAGQTAGRVDKTYSATPQYYGGQQKAAAEAARGASVRRAEDMWAEQKRRLAQQRAARLAKQNTAANVTSQLNSFFDFQNRYNTDPYNPSGRSY
jgi:hypothetical protein